MLSTRLRPLQLLLFLLVAAHASGVVHGQYEQLPPESRKRIAQFDADVKAIRDGAAAEVLAAGQSLVTALDRELEFLERAGRVNDADALQELRNRLADCSSGNSLQELVEKTRIAPAARAHVALGEFLEQTARIHGDAGRQVARLRDEFVESIHRCSDSGSPNVQQVRTRALLAIDPYADESLPEMPADPQDADGVRKRLHVEAQQRYEKMWQRKLVQLQGKLQLVLEQAVQQQRFDEAKALLDLFDYLGQGSGPDTVEGHLSMHRRILSAEAVSLMDQFVRWNAGARESRTERWKELERLAAPQRTGELRQQLLAATDPHGQLLFLLRKHYAQQEQQPAWLNAFGNDFPDPRGEAGRVLSKFDRSVAQAVQLADQADRERRRALLVSLDGLPAPAAEPAEVALRKTRELLEADYAEGLRGTMLLEPDPELPEPARLLVGEYHQQSARARDQLAEQFRTLWTDCRKELEPIRKDLVEKDHLDEAWLTLASLERRNNASPGIWIRVIQQPGSGPNSFRSEWKRLLAASEEGYLIETRGLEGIRSDWVPRDQVILSLAELEEPERLFVDAALVGRNDSGKDPRPIGPGVRLKVGRKAQALRNGSWQEITIDDLSPFGIVHFAGGPNDLPRIYLRGSVSLSR